MGNGKKKKKGAIQGERILVSERQRQTEDGGEKRKGFINCWPGGGKNRQSSLSKEEKKKKTRLLVMSRKKKGKNRQPSLETIRKKRKEYFQRSGTYVGYGEGEPGGAPYSRRPRKKGVAGQGERGLSK